MMSKPEKEEETTAPPPAEETTDQEPVAEAETLAVEPVEEEKETAKSVPAAAEAEKEPGEEEIEVVEEKIYTIPIGRLGYATDRGHRSPKAVRDVRAYVARHMRADEVSISNEINQAIWKRGINKPPRKITVRAVKDKEGKVVVYPSKTA
ncbi:MAG: 50S ribosomal protein L31e [Candidatus Bathyarchaeia archaeon]|jgi:large subunit ribosomal protein L31e